MMNNKLIAGGIGVAIIIIIAVFAYSGTPEVSAQGSATLKAQPDEISVYVQIETKNNTLQDAQQANSDIRERVIDTLLGMGLEEKDIQISTYTNYPWNEWNGNQYVSKGFIVNQQIIVKAKTFAQAPRIVDKVIEAGALVNGINLELSEEKQNEVSDRLPHKCLLERY